jgi:hypothetical protein
MFNIDEYIYNKYFFGKNKDLCHANNFDYLVALYINCALPFLGKFNDGGPCIYNSKTYPTTHGKQASKHGGKELKELSD